MIDIQLPGTIVPNDKTTFGGPYPINPHGTGLNNYDCNSYPNATNDRIFPVVNPLVTARPASVSYEVRPGDKQPHYPSSSGERAELFYEPHDGVAGLTDAICSSWVVPAGYTQMPSGWCFILQNHPGEASPSLSPWFGVSLVNGEVAVEAHHNRKVLGPVTANREFFVAVRTKISETDGFWEVWMSWDAPPDVSKAPWRIAEPTRQGSPMWWKVGLYRNTGETFVSRVIQTTLARRATMADAVIAAGWPALSGGVVIPPPIPTPGWKQTFTEEFDSDPLARGWQPTFAYGGTPAGHTEGDPGVSSSSDSWVSDASGVSVAGGVCTLTLRKEEGTDEITGKKFPYHTGLLQSGGIYDWKKYPTIVMLKPPLFSQLYGRFEAELRGPAVAGTGIGWWLLPTTYHEALDEDGEIDILEVISAEPTTGHYAIHRGYSPGRHWTGKSAIARPSDGFHVYAVEWDKDLVRWLVDGSEVARCTDASLIPSKPMYMTIGLLSGTAGDGWFGGVDESKLPATMQVRAIRVYERTSVVPAPITVNQTIKTGDTLAGTVTWVATTSDDSKVKQVDFSIDGKLRNTESVPPWGSGDPPNTDAGQFNTKPLADGPHVFRAAALLKDGTTSSTEATATVKNVVAPPAPTNAELRDQAVAALKATTVSYPAWKAKLDAGGYPDPSKTKWQQAFDLLAQIK